MCSNVPTTLILSPQKHRLNTSSRKEGFVYLSIVVTLHLIVCGTTFQKRLWYTIGIQTSIECFNVHRIDSSTMDAVDAYSNFVCIQLNSKILLIILIFNHISINFTTVYFNKILAIRIVKESWCLSGEHLLAIAR